MPRIENDAETVVTENWTSQIDDDLRQCNFLILLVFLFLKIREKQHSSIVSDILSFYGYSPYEGDSVKHLLRFFRNMNSHYGYVGY